MNKGYVVALGTFDGVHKGHRKLIERARHMAKEKGVLPMVLTFSNHPMEYLGRPPKLLMSHNRRIECLGELCDRVTAIPFTHEIATMPPREFVKMLMERGGMCGAVMGYNYTFGANAFGDATLMAKLGREMSFDTEIVSPVAHGNRLVSSTLIRSLLEQGHIELANEMLCSHFFIEGKVIRNRRIGGSLLGYPTANIELSTRQVLPKNGVYITRTEYRGRSYASITNIGENPTVNGTKLSIETHIMDFSGDLYDENLKIEFYSYIRPGVKFDTLEELSQRIMVDEGIARSYFNMSHR
ncbi:MAG: bifunctional riboflavin kinase/FAD synthetase [Clostridia bacterium]|nr:bifunctional riboflavin kinase/FAD synthetase [Clostridia bacterium]